MDQDNLSHTSQQVEVLVSADEKSVSVRRSQDGQLVPVPTASLLEKVNGTSIRETTTWTSTSVSGSGGMQYSRAAAKAIMTDQPYGFSYIHTFYFITPPPSP